MKLLIGGALLMMMACAAVPPEEEPVEVGATPGYRCNAEGLRDLIGRHATQELGAEAMRRSGSRRIRWIRPGDVVTMDYSEERLNIHLDAQGRIARFACG